jgi:hypothetical protein
MSNEPNFQKELDDVLDFKVLTETLIVDNKIEFDYNNAKYRVRMPTALERNKAFKNKEIKYLELLQTKGYLLKKKLIEVYKEKGTNIEEYDIKFFDLQKQINENRLVLANKKDENKEEIEDLISRIKTLKLEQQQTLIEKNKLLAYSIEDISEQYYIQCLLVFCTEIYGGESQIWEPIYKNIEDLESGDERLAKRIFYFGSYLFYSASQETN